MDYAKEHIKLNFLYSFNSEITIRKRNRLNFEMEKELFIKSIKLLEEIDDRGQFMAEELGLEMINYEEKFYEVITNLFRIHYSPIQIKFIELYLSRKEIEDFEGTVEVKTGRKNEKVAFNSPEDLWKVISKYK
jgi:hypothetical protein